MPGMEMGELTRHGQDVDQRYQRATDVRSKYHGVTVLHRQIGSQTVDAILIDTNGAIDKHYARHRDPEKQSWP